MTSPSPATPEQRLHASASGSSFHAAMLLLPKHKRRALLTLYALCRALDDAVDDAPDAVTANTALDNWHREVERVFAGDVPVTALAQEFREAHRQYGFDPADMQAMLEALRMDAQGRMLRPSAAELARYCHGVASAVGLMSMRIFGCEGEHARPFAIALGQALQRTNILRDVRCDAAIGRIYLPAEHTAAHITPQLLQTDTAPVQAASMALGAEAREYFLTADRHAQHLSARAIAPALAMRDVYARYWCRLQRTGWHSPADGRIRLGKREKATLATRATRYMLGQFKPVDLTGE